MCRVSWMEAYSFSLGHPWYIYSQLHSPIPPCKQTPLLHVPPPLFVSLFSRSRIQYRTIYILPTHPHPQRFYYFSWNHNANPPSFSPISHAHSPSFLFYRINYSMVYGILGFNQAKPAVFTHTHSALLAFYLSFLFFLTIFFTTLITTSKKTTRCR